MRSIAKVWIAVLALALFSRAAWAATLTASFDHDTLNLGESAVLSLKFDGVQPADPPNLPAIDGLQVQYTGQYLSSTVINNQFSSSIAFNYTVQPQRAGQFTIPALSINVNGQRVTSAPLILTVMKPAAPSASDINSGNEIAFMKLELPEQKVYVGQMLTAQMKIYLRDDIQDYSRRIQFNSMNADGFSLGNNAGAESQNVRIGDRNYRVLPIDMALTATRTGTLTLGPIGVTMDVLVANPNQQQEVNPFGFPIMNQGEERQMSLTSDAVSVQSLPLPEQGRPANFAGAIGAFDLRASVGPTNVLAGDPVTVHVEIFGRGSMDAVTLPDQSAISNFKIFPPTVKTQATDRLGLNGQKSFEEIVTPQSPDVHEWPALSFSFFNPDDGRYHTLTYPAVPLTVRSAGSTPLPTMLAGQPSAPASPAPSDILPIKQNPGSLAAPSAPLVAQPAFLALQSLPVLAFLGVFVWRQRRDSLANNPRLRRRRAVALLVRDGLADLKKFAAENRPDEFFATLFRLLQEQLGERLDCPASAITENVVEEHRLLLAAPAPLREALRELFQLCNQARYAPVRGTSELNSVAARLEKTLRELQELPA